MPSWVWIKDYFGLGIDLITRNRNVNVKLLSTLCSESESDALKRRWSGDENSLRLVVFSAKESLYKLFSGLNFKRMEWSDFCLELNGNEDIEVGFKMKVSLPSKFLDKTDRHDVEIVEDLEVAIISIDGYVLSLVYLEK